MSTRRRKWKNPAGKVMRAWQVHVVEADPAGATVEVRKNAPKDSREKDANTFESKVRTAIREGGWCVPCDDFKPACKCANAPAPLAKDKTVAEFAIVWQARNRLQCAHGTVGFYADCLKVVLAQLGTMLVKDVRFKHGEAFKAFLHEPQTRKRKNGKEYVVQLSPSAINNYLVTLRAMLMYAEKSGEFGEDGRAPRIDLIAQQSEKGKYLTDEQSAAFLAWVKTNEPRWYALVVVMLATGLRIGEAIALERRDVDLAPGAEVLHVNRTYYRGRFDPAGSAQRAIPLEAGPAQVLREHLKVRDLTNPFVFSGTRFKHMTAATPRDLFAAATAFMQGEAAEASASGHKGVEPYTRADNLTPHVLRHTFATRKVGEGVPVKVLSVLMGHASVTTTEIYAKVTDEALRAAMGQRRGSGQ